jgi:hypothetical protein
MGHACDWADQNLQTRKRRLGAPSPQLEKKTKTVFRREVTSE